MSLAVLHDIVSGRAPAALGFTVDEFHRMLADGILTDGAPVELIDGVILHKDRSAMGERPMGHGKRHAVAIARIQRVFERHIAHDACHVRTQLPMTLRPRSEPEPDVTLVAGADTEYLENHPGPADTLLVVEVAESSLEYDRTTKQRIYAAAAVPEYWIVNLIDDQIEVYQSPLSAEQCYARRTDHKAAHAIGLPLSSGASAELTVADLIPPRA